jgi:hypothetical protein
LNASSLTQLATIHFGSGGESLLLPILQACVDSSSSYSGYHVSIISELSLYIIEAHSSSAFLAQLQNILKQLSGITYPEQIEIFSYFSNALAEQPIMSIELHAQPLSDMLKRILRACRSRQQSSLSIR